MDSKGQQLLKLLFNEGETCCPSPNKYSYHSVPLENALSGKITLVSKNPDQPTRSCDSSDLLLVGINPIKGFREDSNVTAYRSFLFECDIGSTKEQIGYFKKLKIPTSCTVFSGNKSVHLLVVLEKDLPDEKTYRLLYEWALNIVTLADQNCRNASRSVRIPGAYREPGKKQRLIFMGSRVKLKDFMDWLSNYPDLRPQIRPKRKALTNGGDLDKLSPWARGQLKFGLKPTLGRNALWYALATDFALAGFTEEQAIEVLETKFVEEHDFKEREWRRTIKSAFEKINK